MSSQTPPLPLTRENIQRLQLDFDRDKAQRTDAQRERYLDAWEERLRAKERELEEREDALNKGRNSSGASICEASSSRVEIVTEVKHDRREGEQFNITGTDVVILTLFPNPGERSRMKKHKS